MSWDIYLYCDCGNELVEANYTSNTNPAARLAAVRVGLIDESQRWADAIRGKEVHVGMTALRMIADEVLCNLSEYRQYDASNGWGNVADMAKVMQQAAERAAEHCHRAIKWKVNE